MYRTDIVNEAKEIIWNRQVVNVLKYGGSQYLLVEILDKNRIVTVYIDEEDSELTHCECSDYDALGYCKHLLAAEYYLELYDDTQVNQTAKRSKTKEEYDRVPISLLTDKAKQHCLKQIQKKEVSLEPTVQIEYTLHLYTYKFREMICGISLRVAKDKFYVVQNVRAFIQQYELQEEWNLGKQAQIDWQIDSLSELDKQILQLLKPLCSDGYYSSLRETKMVTIDEFNMVRLVDLLKQSEHVLMKLNEKGNVFPLCIAEDKSELVHIVGKEIEMGIELTIDMSQQLDVIFPHNIVISNQKLYLVNEDQVEVIRYLSSHIRRKLFIQPKEIPDFLAYTLPLLKQVATVDLSQTNIHLYQEATCEPIIYLHNVGHVLLKVDYQYDTPYPIPNVAREQSVHRTIKRLQFQDRLDNTYTKEIGTEVDLIKVLTSDVPKLERVAKVILDDNLKEKLVKVPEDIQIRLRSRGSLLDISFDIKGLSVTDIDKIMQKILSQETHYTFSDGRLLSLEDDAFNEVHQVLKTVRGKSKLKNGQLSVHKSQVLSVENMVQSGQDELNQLIHDLKFPEHFDATVPKGLQTTLKDYQLLGFKWLKMLAYHNMGGILADDMGLGKTVQSIAYMLSEYEEGKLNDKKIVIVCPASLVYNWQHELKTFAPPLSSCVLTSSKQGTISEYKETVLITSYQLYRRNSEDYQNLPIHTLFLDETQMVKNYTTKLHHSLRSQQTDVVFALTGTPVENKKEDLWSIFALILPGLFPTLKYYRELSEQAIARIAKPFILRRLKKDVLTELPEKIESAMYSELSKEQKEMYVGYLEAMTKRIQLLSNEEMNRKRVEILSGLTRLRQICCHPKLFVEDYEGNSGKLDQFIELVNQLKDSGHRVLVFSQFASMLTILEDTLQANQLTSFTLTGATPKKERLHLVEKFNAGESDVFLISLKAGGTGLNLTSADTIILYDLWWNPAVEEQATGRAHRIGQEKIVQVYRLISQGTIEENIMTLQEKKKTLFDTVVVDESDQLLNRQQLTNEDIREILGIE